MCTEKRWIIRRSLGVGGESQHVSADNGRIYERCTRRNTLEYAQFEDDVISIDKNTNVLEGHLER